MLIVLCNTNKKKHCDTLHSIFGHTNKLHGGYSLERASSHY